MGSIVNAKYLLIHLDDDDDDKLSWKENGVLENEIARTLFAAIDMLPQEFRPLASFALSVDKNYTKEWLYDKLIVIYHGEKTAFGLLDPRQIEWKDLEQKPTTDYINQSEKYSQEALKLMKGANDFFNTKWSFYDIEIALSWAIKAEKK